MKAARAESVALSSLGEVTTGSTPPASHADWFAKIGMPFVTPSDIRDGQRRVITDRFLSPAGVAGMSRRVIPAGAVCFVSIGSTIGKMCSTSVPSVTNQQINALVVDPARGDATYVYYALAQVAPYLKAIAGGSATPILNKTAFSSVVLEVLPVEQQRRIGGLLDALDDKIESNARAAALLDQLARTIFLSWRATAAVEQMTSFGVFAQVFGGATPRTSVPLFWDGGLAWTTPTDVTALSAPYLFETARKITDEGLASCNALLHPPGTIFMTSRATIGAFAVNQIPASTNQGFIAVRPRREEDLWFMFEEMRSRVPEFLDNANGSTFMEISRGRFRELPLAVPARAEVSKLAILLEPLHATAAQLVEESRQLGVLRDTLLPELLAGRTRVPAGTDVLEIAHELENA